MLPTGSKRKEEIDGVLMAQMSCRLASAMAFLEHNRIVHRDVAARNVLVGETALDVKLSDLGAARNVKGRKDYEYTATTTHMPARWMPLVRVLGGKCIFRVRWRGHKGTALCARVVACTGAVRVGAGNGASSCPLFFF